MNYNEMNTVCWIIFLLSILFLISYLVLNVGLDIMIDILDRFKMMGGLK